MYSGKTKDIDFGLPLIIFHSSFSGDVMTFHSQQPIYRLAISRL